MHKLFLYRCNDDHGILNMIFFHTFGRHISIK
uniref:Uncharacterized protein n=1 Tax=Rhizophora mucronata TaxID=61149 RepID=A0A2P2NWA2_RHIMU